MSMKSIAQFKCIRCQDTGYIPYEVSVPTRRGNFSYELGRKLCSCRLWDTLGATYPSLEPIVKDQEVSKLFIDDFDKFNSNIHIAFFGGSILKFFRIVKYFLLFDHDPLNSKLIISSNEFTEKFFMPRDDFTEGRVSDSTQYDKIFLSFGTGVVRPSTPKVMHELLSYRVNTNKFMWIYSHNTIKRTPGYSDDMESLLIGFKFFNLKNLEFVSSVSKSAAQRVNDQAAGS